MGPLVPFRPVRSFARRLLPTRNVVVALLLAVGITLVAPAGAQEGTDSTYGPVQRDDTLWELALRFRRGADVTAQQVMIAIVRANPEAFREGNVNALRTGVILRVPSAAEMTAITREEAIAEFNRHEEAWRNRQRTGTAAPAPGPAAAPARAAQTAPAPDRGAEEATEIEAQLRAARTEVTELNRRLAERDDAIEELLVQLAAERRKLRRLEADSPAQPVPPSAADDDAEGDGAARATWLPVSPLVLGSSLIVLLVLIVVVTLIRQRGGEREEPYPEDEGEEELRELMADEAEEKSLFDEHDFEPGSETEDSERVRADARPASLTAAAVGVVGGLGSGREEDDPEPDNLPIGVDLEEEDDSEPGPDDPADEHSAAVDPDDLPIGMDLEEEEDEWEPGPDVLPTEHSVPVDPDDPIGLGRHVEVGELDKLDLEDGSDRASFAEVSDDLDDLDDGESPADGERRG